PTSALHPLSLHDALPICAQVHMFQTNNADFRGTDEHLQQLAMARMRAVESGRSVVNLSTTGTSQVFAPDGTTVAAIPADEPGVIDRKSTRLNSSHVSISY